MLFYLAAHANKTITHRELLQGGWGPDYGGEQEYLRVFANLEGFHSIRVNQQWRLIFQWDGGQGEATGVYLDDHGYL